MVRCDHNSHNNNIIIIGHGPFSHIFEKDILKEIKKADGGKYLEMINKFPKVLVRHIEYCINSDNNYLYYYSMKNFQH